MARLLAKIGSDMALSLKGTNEIPSCHGGLENLDEEHEYEMKDVEGELPKNLRGTFFRNGPGRQKIGEKKYGHWFDGDGMLCAYTFSEGRIFFKNRYVRTPKYLKETESQDIRFRGFGTQIPGGLKANFLKMPANPANTSTIYHGGRLLALNEGGKPWEVDPSNLETRGEFTYDGGLEPSMVFSAHGKVHPRTGDYINFGAGIAGFGIKGPKPCLNVYRVDRNGQMVEKHQVPLDNFPFCHDFALSDRYAIFFLGSIVFGNMLPVVLGTRTISDQVIFDPGIPMQIVVLDIEKMVEVKRFETAPGAIIHFGNSYENGREIVIDGMFQDSFIANETLKDVFNPEGRFGGGWFKRYFLNLASGALRVEDIFDHECEFPTFNSSYVGKKNEITYSACSIDNGSNSFFNGMARISGDGSSDVMELEPGYYGSEPMFAPSVDSKNEGDGYLLVVVYNGFEHRSELRIYKATEIGDPICTLKHPHHLPHQFHGFFSPEVFKAA